MTVKFSIFCPDVLVLNRLRPVVSGLNAKTEVWGSLQSAETELAEKKLAGIVLDCDTEGVLELIAQIRSTELNQKTILIAVGKSETTREAFKLGANFVLEKPLALERIQKTLRAANSLIQKNVAAVGASASPAN
jgi:DNA-binding NtrC family response regulator